MKNSLHCEDTQNDKKTHTMKRTSLLIYIVLPIACAFIYSLILNRLYAYYDMGVNESANFGAIIFITLPTMLIIFFVTTGATNLIASKIRLSQSKTFILVVTLLILVFSVSFLNEFWSLSDYPVSKPYNIIYFLSHFFDG